MDLIGSATQLDGTIESYRFDITIDSFDQMNLDTFKANSVSTQIVFNLAKIVDFITINKISIELCFLWYLSFNINVFPIIWISIILALKSSIYLFRIWLLKI